MHSKQCRVSLVVIAVAVGACLQDAGASPLFRSGAVATQHPVATAAGLDMLRKGGNATDAAVAAAFTLAVVAPYHSGLGGGGFALVYQAARSKTQVLDFREVAPQKAHATMFMKDGHADPALSQDGALSIAVPGAVAGYLELLKTQGSLPAKVVLAPAIQAAKRGFWVSPEYQRLATDRLNCLSAFPESAQIFLARTPNGHAQVPPLGMTVRQPDLAKTMETLATQGARAFYSGPLAKAMVTGVQSQGGLLTEADLAQYKVRWREPLETTYRGHRVQTMPPPSAGGLAIVQVLSMLEMKGPSAPFRDVEGTHLLIEALRRVYVDRAKYLGDPAFTNIPLQTLTSPDHLSKLLASISAKATPSQSLLPVEGTEEKPLAPNQPLPKNTSHISVVDGQGNAVAMTTTVNYGFGSCLTAKGTGILMNDQMDDFAAQPMTPNAYGLVTGSANAVAPGKIPLSSMSPTIVFQKDEPQNVLLVVGARGGPTIPTSTLQTLLNVVDHGMDISRALAAGRLHHQYMPDVLWVDKNGMEPETAKALEGKGHKLQRRDPWGDVQAVLVDPLTQLRSASADPRNEGQAAGHD